MRKPDPATKHVQALISETECQALHAYMEAEKCRSVSFAIRDLIASALLERHFLVAQKTSTVMLTLPKNNSKPKNK